MTHEQLRDLLRDRVAHETMPDHSGRAWAAGRRARRRRRTGMVTGAAAAVVAAVAVTSTLGGSREPSPSPAPPVSSEPDATYQGIPVWWSPDQVEERSLAQVASAVPEGIDLGAGSPDPAADLDAAVAAFGIGDEVRLVDEAGAQMSVDVSSLDDVTNENGYPIAATSDSMLSPDGRHLAFPQDDSVAVYDIATGEWSGFSTEAGGGPYLDWMDERTMAVKATKYGRGPHYDLDGTRVGGGRSTPLPFTGFATGESQPYGPTKEAVAEGRDGFWSVAHTWGMGAPLPVRDGSAPSPEFMGFRTTDNRELRAAQGTLAFMNDLGDGQDGRWKNCCPVAGWLDPDTVVYESRQSQPLLVAWTVGTDQFRLVTRISGEYDVASFAALHDGF